MSVTVVTGSFTADHQRPFDERRHGHDWHVRAAFPSGEHYTDPQDRLDRLLNDLDHQFLDLILSDPSNEGIAEWVGRRLECVWVYVHRFAKGREFGGEWRP